MHVQIVNFQLKDMSEADYLKACEELAPAFAEVAGLMAKVWIADSAKNTYGGIYLWKDREAMEEYGKTELFNMVATHPNFAGITSKDFAVIEAPTRIDRGFIAGEG